MSEANRAEDSAAVDCHCSTRYQHCGPFVRAVRWWRWVPLYRLIGASNVALWCLCGARVTWPHESRVEVAANIMSIWRSSADMRMQHWYTTEELIASLNRKEA